MLSLRYSFRYTQSTEKSQVLRILPYLCIDLLTPKVHKKINFSGYPLTWVLISLQQNRSKSKLFRIPTDLGMHLVTEGTQKSQYFKIFANLGIHLLTPKALKSLKFSGYPSPGNTSRYTKTTQKFQLFRIPSRLGIHLGALKALTNLTYSAYRLTSVSISLN